MTAAGSVVTAARATWRALDRMPFAARARLARDAVRAMSGAAEVPPYLAADTGLSRENVTWGLQSMVDAFSANALERLATHVPPGARATDLAAVVLPGNVFAAAFQGLLLPWLAGVPVVAKLPRHGGTAAVLLTEYFRQLAPAELADSMAALRIGREEQESLLALVGQASLVSIYGADEAVRAVRTLARADARIAAHGHGVSVAWVSAGRFASLAEREQAALARGLAEDVVAYDQRGCLSPQALIIEAPEAALAKLANAVALALVERGKAIPLGPGDADARAHDRRWRETARALGELAEHPTAAVSIETALRGSHGRRHLGVVAMPSRAAVVDSLRALGPHLKLVGVVEGETDSLELTEQLRPQAHPRVVTVGEMQTPPADAFMDGRPPFEGFFEYQGTR
jgi:hypothetical protein